MVIVLAVLVAACSPPQPEPRSFFVFMEDGIAREGVLARCNVDRDATAADVECTNARRAAAAIALEQERERRVALARESERKLVALRDRAANDALAQERAAAAARAAAESAYEQQWHVPQDPSVESATAAPPSAPAFGAPLGPVLPSMSETTLFDVYANGGGTLRPPSLEPMPAEAPANAMPIAPPDLELEEVAIIPRPFRTLDGVAIPQ